MLEEYKEISAPNGGVMYRGSLSFIDLKKFATDLQCSITVKGLRGTVTFSTESMYVSRSLAGYPFGRRFVSRFVINGTTSDKFTDIVKALQNVGYRSGDDVLIIVSDYTEIVELSDGDLHVKDYDVVFTYDTDEWVLKDDAYFCITNEEWYESDNELVYIQGDGFYLEDDDNICWCDRCEEYHHGNSTEVNVGRGNTEWWCECCVDNHAFYCDDCGECWADDYRYLVDRPSCTVCENCYNDNYFYCGECGSTVHGDYWDSDEEHCEDCACGKYVRSYHWHHVNSYTNKNTLFMPKGKMVSLRDSSETKTVGIELEVSKDSKDVQNETIEKLCNLPLETNEIFFEHDGSLDYGGFEIITGVHTFESLKTMPWKDILKVLRDNGYRSHNGGLCGLHVHVGRKFFGDNENAQFNAIGKIYAFYSLFWDDIVRASRRERFTYCGNPCEDFDNMDLKSEIVKSPSNVRQIVFNKAKNKDGSHGLALNNRNDATFEFRLGRGTLVYESFMAWIDFTLTVAKNSKRISIRNLNNCDEWLKGISRETAVYLYSRTAFPESEIIRNLTNEGVAICA